MENLPLLACSLLGMQLTSPIIVGSGPLTDSLGRIKKYFRLVAGAVIGKTIYFVNDDDVIEKIHVSDVGMFNSNTYSKKSVTELIDILEALVKDKLNVIPSIHASSPALLGSLASQIKKVDCKAIELGVACPNDGSQQKMSSKLIFEYTYAVKKVLDIPIIVKLAATDNYLDHILAALKGGAAAISLSDTIPAIAFDVNERKYIFNEPAGYSGPAIKPIVLHAIYQARKMGVRCPIIGIGGIQSATDVLEYLHVGANAVQIYTALMLKPPNLIATINEDLKQWCLQQKETINNLPHSSSR